MNSRRCEQKRCHTQPGTQRCRGIQTETATAEERPADRTRNLCCTVVGVGAAGHAALMASRRKTKAPPNKRKVYDSRDRALTRNDDLHVSVTNVGRSFIDIAPIRSSRLVTPSSVCSQPRANDEGAAWDTAEQGHTFAGKNSKDTTVPPEA